MLTLVWQETQIPEMAKKKKTQELKHPGEDECTGRDGVQMVYQALSYTLANNPTPTLKRKQLRDQHTTK